MKHLPFALALVVLAGLALAFLIGRPEPADDSLFGPQIALPPALPPLEIPGGELALRGAVVTAAGTPAPDVLVTLLRADDDPSRAEPLYHAYTDAAGRFELARLAPGRYTAVLVHRDVPPRSFAVELPLPTGEAARPEGVRWELPPPLPPLEVLPELTRGEVAGRVALPPALAVGADLAGLEVVLAPAAGTPPLVGAGVVRATTDAEGRFAIPGVVAAQYDAEVRPPWARGGSWPVLGRGTVRVEGGGSAALELALEVGALAGELGEQHGGPLSGALVAVSALEAADATAAPQLWPPATSDDAGRFRVEFLPPGRYRVHLRAGAASADTEVRITAGTVTQLQPTRLDVRAGTASAASSGG